MYMCTDAVPPSSASELSEPSLSAALSSGQPVLVEFYADWCGPCRAVGPDVEALATEMRGKAKVLRFDVDKNQDLSRSYGVSGIPAFISFIKGKEASRHVGGISKAQMRTMLGL